MVTRVFLYPMLLLAAAAAATENKYDPGPGRTLLLIGQTYKSEFAGYVGGFGKAPAGSSHYGELYTGRINQGDDGRGLEHLGGVAKAYPCAYALVAISWKDNPDLSDHPIDACGRDFPGRRIYQVSRDISQGRYDASLDSLAAVMRGNPSVRFLVRIEYEVSRFLFSWKDQARCPVPGQPVDFADNSLIDDGAYRDAYNHIALRLRGKGAVANAAFVYHPVRGFDDAVALYPGPANVDFIALSMFNHDLCVGVPGCRDSLDANAAKVLAWGKGTAGKPLMFAEAAPQPPATSSEAGFIDYLDRLLGAVEKYDVRALAYINSDWTAHGWDARYWGDSRLEARPAVKAWWAQKAVAGPRFVHYGCLAPTGAVGGCAPGKGVNGGRAAPTGGSGRGGFSHGTLRIRFQGSEFGADGARDD